MNIIKKISTKVVAGNVKKLVIDGILAENGGQMNVMRVMGNATAYKTGTSDNGDWTALRGQFKAIALCGDDEGKEYVSSVCFLPDVAMDMVLAQLMQEGVNGVEFAYDIHIVADEDSATGYVYGCNPLLAPSEDDPLQRLAAQLPELPALSAPKKAAAKK